MASYPDEMNYIAIASHLPRHQNNSIEYNNIFNDYSDVDKDWAKIQHELVLNHIDEYTYTGDELFRNPLGGPNEPMPLTYNEMGEMQGMASSKSHVDTTASYAENSNYESTFLDLYDFAQDWPNHDVSDIGLNRNLSVEVEALLELGGLTEDQSHEWSTVEENENSEEFNHRQPQRQRRKRSIEALYGEDGGTRQEAAASPPRKKAKVAKNGHETRPLQTLSNPPATHNREHSKSPIVNLKAPSKKVNQVHRAKPTTCAKEYHPKPRPYFDDKSLVDINGWPVKGFRLRNNTAWVFYKYAPAEERELYAAPPGRLREDLPPLDHAKWGIRQWFTQRLHWKEGPETQGEAEDCLKEAGNGAQWEFKLWAEGFWHDQYQLDKKRCINAWRTEKARRMKIVSQGIVAQDQQNEDSG